MKKDQKIISQVINEHKNKVEMVFVKLYRLLKSVKRSIAFDSDQSSNYGDGIDNDDGIVFSELIIKLVRDSYNLIDDKDNDLGLPIPK